MNPIDSPITDDDLVLYHYRDGLDAARVAEITAALAASSELRERYVAMERALASFDINNDDTTPDRVGAERIWKKLEPQLEEAGVLVSSRKRKSLSSSWITFAAAAGFVVAIGVAFLVGRHSVTPPPQIASTEADGSAARVLEAYVSANLRATEGVILTASNANDTSLLEGNSELAQSLVESNRLYALAATRAGNAKLADFLRQLEPVLLSLANQSDTATIQSSEDLRRFLDTTDLMFQLRATQARLSREAPGREPKGSSNGAGDTI